MNQLILFFMSLTMFNSMTLFDFSIESNPNSWKIIDDVVMGGRSDGHFEINQEGNGVFYGNVSVENNGGFSSVRYRFTPENIEGYSNVLIRLKGDGKSYQFRIKSNQFHRESYIYHFETTGEWETISIPFSQMKPSFRGRILDMPNYSGLVLEEIIFLISNKKTENFRLQIDKIILGSGKKG